MSLGPESGSRGERVDVTLDQGVANRLHLLRNLVEVSSLPDDAKQECLSALNTDRVMDEAVSGFLDGITAELDELLPDS